MRRIRWAVLLLSAAVVFAPSGMPSAQENTIKVGVNLTTSDADPWYAADTGIFKKLGLTVDIQTLTGGAAIASAVASGALDVGVSNMLSLGNAVAHGIPIKVIAPGFLYDTAAPLSRVMVAPNSGIQTAKDLNGKTVCGISVGGMDQLAMYAWIDKNGGDSSTVRFIELTPASQIEGVESGRVAACTLGEPYASDALSSKRLRAIGATYDAVAPTFMMVGYFAGNDWIAKNPALARKFYQAMGEASVWAAAHPEEAAAIDRKYMKANITRVHEKPSRVLSPELLQPVLDGALKYKLISRPVSGSEMIWSGVTSR
jgi:NitT/TauT family transport system substrate-binding protein